MAVTLLEAARSERPRRGQGDDSALLATSSGCVRASLVLPTSLSSERPSMSQKVEFTSTNFPVISAKTIPMGALSKACWKRSWANRSSTVARPASDDRWRPSCTTLHPTAANAGTRPSATVAVQATQSPRPVVAKWIASDPRRTIAAVSPTRRRGSSTGGPATSGSPSPAADHFQAPEADYPMLLLDAPSVYPM